MINIVMEGSEALTFVANKSLFHLSGYAYNAFESNRIPSNNSTICMMTNTD